MKGGITATKTSKAANSANSLWPMLNSTDSGELKRFPGHPEKGPISAAPPRIRNSHVFDPDSPRRIPMRSVGIGQSGDEGG
jgi:hypothetical protein